MLIQIIVDYPTQESMINVVFGGSLHLDVHEVNKRSVVHIDYDHYDTHRHPLTIFDNTPLMEWYKQKELLVNTYHHQGIKKLAPNLVAMVSATALSFWLASGSLRMEATCSLCAGRNIKERSCIAARASFVKPSGSTFRISLPSKLPTDTCSVVLANKQQQVVARFASDIDGKFTGELKTPGTYVVVISFVGKEPTKRRFTVGPNNRSVQLGKIGMADNKQTLKEVNIVATRPLIKAEADKITYDTEQDPETKTSTVLDVLRKVPMVTVDGQDNIQLKGASNFKFFLNGKPTNMPHSPSLHRYK